VLVVETRNVQVQRQWSRCVAGERGGSLCGTYRNGHEAFRTEVEKRGRRVEKGTVVLVRGMYVRIEDLGYDSTWDAAAFLLAV
jgi:hypothetical protein